jgi:hypothetical protein
MLDEADTPSVSSCSGMGNRISKIFEAGLIGRAESRISCAKKIEFLPHDEFLE